VGLFGILFAGILGTIYPFFTGSANLTKNIATDGETAFIVLAR
jgi:hypothetical protein